MSRFSRYDDDDDERLPEGMTRVGYDADTQVYTYRDADGSYWEGAPGARYGRLTRVSGPRRNEPEDGADANDPFLPGGHKTNTLSWRQEYMPLLHFFMLIGLFLVAVFWFLHSSAAVDTTVKRTCGEGMRQYRVAKGDTCWDIANNHRWDLEKFMGENVAIDCDNLRPGDVVCIPKA